VPHSTFAADMHLAEKNIEVPVESENVRMSGEKAV